MIVTTSMKNKKGQECINASFLKLNKQIDEFQPETTDQDYNVFSYNGTLTAGQKLEINPAPLQTIEVIATTPNNRAINLGTVGTDGVLTIPSLSCSYINSSTTEWTDSSTTSYCESTNDTCPASVEEIFKCCYSCKDYWPPSFSWNCWGNIDTASYCYYKNGCIKGYDINGNPIYNYDCLTCCCFCCGIVETSAGCDETIIYNQSSFESWIADGDGIYNARCSISRSEISDYCNCPLYRCLYTSKYKCYCCYKSKTGETVCVGLKEDDDDTVEIVYYSGGLTDSCPKHLCGASANTVSQCVCGITYPITVTILCECCVSNLHNSVYLCEHEGASPYSAENWACICCATLTDCGSRSVDRDAFPKACCLSFTHTVYTNPNSVMIGVNCCYVGQIVKDDEDYDKVSQSIPYNWLNYQSYLNTIACNNYNQGGAGYWCYSYENCSCVRCRCPFDAIYIPAMKKRTNTSYCVVVRHHITEDLDGCCFSINLIYR